MFTALDAAAAEDNALAAYGTITVREYMRTWSEQGGHPLLTVAVDHTTGRMTVTQVKTVILRITQDKKMPYVSQVRLMDLHKIDFNYFLYGFCITVVGRCKNMTLSYIVAQ